MFLCCDVTPLSHVKVGLSGTCQVLPCHLLYVPVPRQKPVISGSCLSFLLFINCFFYINLAVSFLVWLVSHFQMYGIGISYCWRSSGDLQLILSSSKNLITVSKPHVVNYILQNNIYLFWRTFKLFAYYLHSTVLIFLLCRRTYLSCLWWVNW